MKGRKQQRKNAVIVVNIDITSEFQLMAYSANSKIDKECQVDIFSSTGDSFRGNIYSQ